MTVETEVSSKTFIGIIDGVALNIDFPIQADTELQVSYGANVLLVEGVHYTVALVPPNYLTATVTPLPGMAALTGGTVAVQRVIPYLQPTDIPTLATLASSRLEQMLDRACFMAQQLRDKLVRTVQYPATDTPTALSVLPAAADRALKYLAFDALGNPVASAAPLPAGTPLTAFGAAWVALASIMAGRAYLGVVALAGDTMTGLLTLSGPPVNNLHASTKKYVDDAVTALTTSFAASIAQAQFPIGVPVPFMGREADLPTGFLLLSGKTIGDALSSGSQLASADAVTLYTYWWNSTVDADAPVSTGRGVSAIADFNAHKTITMLDLRGRAIHGLDTMDGSAANRITVAGGNFDGTKNGRAGGAQSQSHTVSVSGTLSVNVSGTASLNPPDNLAPVTAAGSDSVASNIHSHAASVTAAGSAVGTSTGTAATAASLSPASVLPMMVRYK